MQLIAESSLYKLVKNGDLNAIKYFLDRTERWGMTSKDKVYFDLKKKELEQKTRENDIEEIRVNRVLGDAPDE